VNAPGWQQQHSMAAYTMPSSVTSKRYNCILPLKTLSYLLTPRASSKFLSHCACCCCASDPLLHALPSAEPSLLHTARRQLGSSSRGHTFNSIALILDLFSCTLHTPPQSWLRGSRSSRACPPRRRRMPTLCLTLPHQSTVTRSPRARTASTLQTSAHRPHST
jgi:hypothetical protein